MEHRRQTKLGSSRGVLCLRSPIPLPPGETTTAPLPDEILAIIFSYLPQEAAQFRQCEDRGTLTLPYVCKRWCKVYEVVLYRTLGAGEYWWKDPYRTSQLLSNLSQQPDRGSYVREVNLTFWRPSTATLARACRLLSYCKCICFASLHADFTAEALPLIKSLARQPLQRLSLSGQSSGPALEVVLDYFDLSTLQYLSLSRYGVNGQPAAEWRRIIEWPASQDLLDQLLPPHRLYTASVTSMVLSDPSTPPDVSAHILRWPRRLERLTLTGLNHSVYSRDYTLPGVQNILDVQRKSLKHIRLGIFGGGAPDFSAFPCLEWLSLSMWQMRHTNPADVFRKLAAPKLRFLRMDFSPEDQHSEHYTDFAQPQTDWLSDFAACKTKDAAAANCLETISIVFNPDVGGPWVGFSDLDYPWPWDYLEEAARRISEYDINLIYSTPSCTRQEWDELKECAGAMNDTEELDFGESAVDSQIVT